MCADLYPAAPLGEGEKDSLEILTQPLQEMDERLLVMTTNPVFVPNSLQSLQHAVHCCDTQEEILSSKARVIVLNLSKFSEAVNITNFLIYSSLITPVMVREYASV